MGHLSDAGHFQIGQTHFCHADKSIHVQAVHDPALFIRFADCRWGGIIQTIRI